MASQMTYCGFCRRLTCERTGAGPVRRGQEAGPVTDRPFLPDDSMTEEAYCHDCERFYHQLVTFGRGNTLPVDWSVAEPPVQESPQPGMTTGFPT
ncbi:MAG: hypothetical protein H8K08_16640 [Nitrospira sp.]|nr:hypothetical protein [Nitrospira sp.]